MTTIFIPGIKGTELIDTYPMDQPSRWPVAGALPGDMVDDPRVFALQAQNPDGDKHRLKPGRVVPRICAPLIHALRADLEPQPVLAFGYDWRQPLEHSARRLLRFLDDVVERDEASGRAPGLSFVTHSMGGLLLRSALALRNREDPFAGIDRVVFIAPPFRGSLGTTFALVAGENDEWLGIGPAYRKITRGFAPVYQMTPSWPGAACDEDGTELDLFDAANWQANVIRSRSFRSDLLRNAEAFVRAGATRHGGQSSAPMLGGDAALAEAADKVLVICGSGQPTPCALPVLARNTPNPHWFDFAHMRMDSHGDGRVWMPSAAIKGVTLAAFADSGPHALICRDERVIRLTSLWLAGKGATRLTPRTRTDSTRREKRCFDPWDGSPGSLASHVA